MFYRAPNSVVGSGQKLIRPKISEQLDYEGEIAMVIGRECKHVPKESALDVIAGITLCNEGTIRDWMRHGKFNVTQGKNFDATGSIGPWIETDDRPDQAAAPCRAQERRGNPGRHHGEHDFFLRRSHRLRHDVHDAQAGRYHLHRHTGQNRAESRPAGLAQTWRHHRGRVLRTSACCAIPLRTKRDNGRPRGVRHRLAGRTLALASHSQLLAPAIRNRRRIPARTGAGGRVRGVRAIARSARLCRRQRDGAA